MADDVTLPGTGAVIATDEATDPTLGTAQFQYVKLAGGALGDTTKIEAKSADPVGTEGAMVVRNIPSGTQHVDGPLTDAQLRATALPTSTADGQSATLGAKADGAWDGAAAAPSGISIWKAIYNRLAAIVTALAGGLPGALSAGGNLKVSLQESNATQSVTGSVSVSSLPGTTFAGQTPKTSDFDTGAGVDTVAMLGIALPKAGGAVVGGTANDPLRTDPTGTTTQPVSGTVTANVGTTNGLALDATVSGVAKDGTPITGQALEAGGASVTGWLSSLRKAITDRLGTLGQKTMANSTPVAIASDQSAVATSNAATSQADGHSASIGATTDASTANTVIGRLKALIALLPASLGQKTMANSLAVAIASDQSVLTTQGNPKVTYRAVYRLAARPYAMSKVFSANTRVQFATIHHTAGSTKTVKIRRVLVAVESSSVAAITAFDLARITTAPATGNPAITPSPVNPGDAAAEATCLALPTTAGTEGALHSTLEYNLGITGAASTVNPPPPLTWYELYSEDEQNPMGEQKSLTLRPATLEGFAVIGDCNAASTVKAQVIIIFTEE